MFKRTHIKVGHKKRAAHKRRAGQQIITMSTHTDRVIEDLLNNCGIDWRAEDWRVSVHAR